MTKVCTHAGLSNKEKRLLTPEAAFMKPDPLPGEGLRESGDDGGETGGAGRRVLDRVFRGLILPASSEKGVREERRLPILRAISSFSIISISTSFISSLTPCPRGIADPSRSIFAPKTKNNRDARKLVYRLGINVGTAWPRTAERMVITINAENAAEKTTMRGCFIAINAAIKKVLSPISENMIMVKDKTKE